MKSISIILSIYILFLTGIPCQEDGKIESNLVDIEFMDSSNNNDIELCSPFCFFSCCQTISLPSSFSTIFYNIISSELTVYYFGQEYYNSPNSIWQPPKV